MSPYPQKPQGIHVASTPVTNALWLSFDSYRDFRLRRTWDNQSNESRGIITFKAAGLHVTAFFRGKAVGLKVWELLGFRARFLRKISELFGLRGGGLGV